MDVDIGSTLREARMRRRIDLGDVEADTKIRVRYLRALENEEWAVLPGPTYTRSFIRTYAAYLGLDGERLVDSFRRRHEPELAHPQHGEAPLVAAGHGAPRRGRGLLAAAVTLALLGLLLVLGLTAGDEGERPRRPPAEPQGERAQAPQPQPAAPRRPALRLRATGRVWVCLVDARGRRLVDGAELAAGDARGPFRSRRFRLTLGNGQARLLAGGRPRAVPPSSDPLGYEIRGASLRPLAEAERPTCE